MTFDVAAEAYDAFMGAWSAPLAPQLADLANIRRGERVLDVGCGPGALTRELVTRLSAGNVAAVDPSPPFVAAVRERNPGVDVRRANAEALPFGDDVFDAALAQLVVHLMRDPVAGLREMARVSRSGGVVAASVWDYGTRQSALEPFWRAVREADPDVDDESRMAGAREGHLAELFAAAGLRHIESATFEVSRRFETFDEWWTPFTAGVGVSGGYVAKLDPAAQAALRERCRATLPEAPFVLEARAWAARGTV
ncbi:MAG TPA: class I SAM-dependent methyltransferase [Candidatus Limnocylindrales bacterium]|nr:class I SAM-dependent methyltransferase [Candidatus Limnocylindrales bacterium]